MANQIIPYRVHYLNLQPSDALTAAIEQGMAQLAPHRDRVASCDVHVGCWVQHHDLGRSYRVTLEIEPRGNALPVSVECESAQRNPAYAALLEQTGEAFRRASRRLSARAQYAALEVATHLSPDARRLHPLHGLAPEEQQPGTDDA